MESKTIASGILRALFTLAAIAIGILFLIKIQSLIIYIIIAGVISLIGVPIIDFLKRKLKFKKTLAVITTMLILCTMVFSLIALFIPLILEQGNNLALLNSAQFKENIERILNEFNSFLFSRAIDVVQELKSFDFSSNLVSIPNFFKAIINALGSFSIGLFSVLFITFFFMKDRSLVVRTVFNAVPKSSSQKVKKSLTSIKILLSRYFLGLIMQISILFIIYTMALLLNDVNNALVIAFLCALLNLIPYLGPLIGGFLMVLLTMSGNLGQDFSTVILPTVGYVIIWYVFAQLIDNFLSQPLIFSKSVKSHPLEIFLVISIGGLVFGISGMILAVPVYTVLKVILKEFLPQNRVVQFITRSM